MSDHAHDHHESHGNDSQDHGHDVHGHESHGHDDLGHGHGHAEHWGDYNAKPLPPSTLPPISPIWLSAFGLALGALMAAIVMFSLRLSVSPEHADAGHHDSHKSHKHDHGTDHGAEKKHGKHAH